MKNKKSNMRSKNFKNNKSSRDSKPSRNGDAVQCSTNPVNDYRWYSITENIGKAGASLPYSVFTGTRERLPLSNTTYFSDYGEDKSFNSTPGVMVLEYAPVPGSSFDPTSAVNVAARAEYSYVRHQNSGSKNYESPDLMLYILAMQDIYGSLIEARRIYRLANTYDGENRLIPDLIMRALGVDPANIRSNLAQFRYGLNLLIAKTSSLFIPKKYHTTERQALLASLVLTDSSSIRSQFYVFKKKWRWEFNATASETGGRLETYANGELRTYQDLLNDISSSLDVLLADEDINIMSGDILKAYGRENCIELSEVNELETQEFTYDMDMLNQIENSFCSPFVIGSLQEDGTTRRLLIDQTDGWLRCLTETDPIVLGDDPNLNRDILQTIVGVTDRFFNSHKDYPEWKDNLEWSRLVNTCQTPAGDISGVGPVKWSVGTEVLYGYRIYTIDYNSGEVNEPVVTYLGFNNCLVFDPITSDPDIIASQYKIITTISKFDWHPIIYLFTWDATGENLQYLDAMYDSKVHTIVSSETFKRLNDMASMGVFASLLR